MPPGRASRVLIRIPPPPPDTLRPVGTPGLSLLVLYCTDLDGCRRFYTALGLDFSPEQHGQGPGHWAAVLAGGTVLELYPATAARTTGAVRLGLVVTVGDLTPGRHLLYDPDGRAVEVEVHDDPAGPVPPTATH